MERVIVSTPMWAENMNHSIRSWRDLPQQELERRPVLFDVDERQQKGADGLLSGLLNIFSQFS